MKKTLALLCVLLSVCRCPAAITFHINNVGTNDASVSVWRTGFGDPGISGSGGIFDTTVLSGTTATGSDGGDSADGHGGYNVRYGINATHRTNTLFIGNPGSGVTLTYSVNITAQGPPTNCVYAFNIVNPSLEDADYSYAVSQCSSFTTNQVHVPAGGTTRISWTDPCCGGGFYSYYRIGWQGAPPTSDNPLGQGGNSGVAAGIAPLASAPPVTAPPPPVVPPPYIPPPTPGPLGPGTPPNTAGPNTNGPINYGTNAVNNPTNVAANSTIQQGDSAIYTAISTGDADIVNAIKQADINNQAGNSNLNLGLGAIETNTYNTASTLSNIFGYTTNASNLLNTNFDASVATNAGSSFRSGAMAGISNLLSQPTDHAPASSPPMTVVIGSYTIDCNPLHITAIASLATWVRAVMTFGIALMSIRTAWTALEAYIAQMGGVRQATTAGQEILGFNVAAPSAQAMAIGITLALAVVPAFFVTWAGTTDYITTISGGIYSSASGPMVTALSLMNAFMPLDYMVASAVGVLIFRMGLGVFWAVATTIARHLTGV